jgi:hypothetical protein
MEMDTQQTRHDPKNEGTAPTQTVADTDHTAQTRCDSLVHRKRDILPELDYTEFMRN